MKLALAVLVLVASQLPPAHPSSGFTDLGYCWYCGPACYVSCPWASFYPTFVSLAHAPNITRTTLQNVSHPAVAINANGTKLLVQSREQLLVSDDGGHSFAVCPGVTMV